MFLLDTNICIYAITHRSVAVVKKVRILEPHEIKISSITVAELEYGASKSRARDKNRLAILGFVSAFDILPFDENDAEVYGKIRADLESKGQVIGPYDMQIAAQALARDLTVVTNNVREFERIAGLRLEDWVND